MAALKAKLETRSRLARAAVEHYALELRRYIRRRLYGRSHDLDDLAQEVYLRLLRVDDTKFIEKPLAYVYRVAAHVVADYRIAAEHHGGIVPVDWETVTEEWELPAAGAADPLADQLYMQQRISRALEHLPATHAAVFVLRHRDGLSHEEVATRMQLSPHTVKKYLAQAKALIRTMSPGEQEK